MSETNHTLGLLSALVALPPADLARVLSIRGLAVSTKPDLLDTATAMGSGEAVWRHLCQLSRSELTALAQPQQLSPLEQERWERALLIHQSTDSFSRRPEVEALWSRVTDTLEQTSRDEPRVRIGSDALAEVDIPVVFGHLEALSTLVGILQREPFVGPSPLGEKHLERLSRVAGLSPTALSGLFNFSQGLGLLEQHDGQWRPRPIGLDWLGRGAAGKWQILLEQFHRVVPSWWPEALPSPATAELIARDVAVRFPLVDSPTVAPWVDRAEWLGLIRLNRPTELSQATSSEAIVGQVANLVPVAVDQLYPDGPDTLVATGPLSDHVEAGMRQVGEWLSGSLAPRFRITGQTVVKALQEGSSATALTQFLERHVLGGTQSAVADLLRETAKKATSLSLLPRDQGSELRSAEQLTIELLQADRRLLEARWERLDELTLRSPRGVSELHTLLLEEGYPHLVVDHEGALVSTGSSNSHSVPEPEEWSSESASAALGYWSSQRNDSRWWTRVIELAVASKTPVRLVVEAGASEQVISMAPQSLTNGRLRGVDTRSDVERTVPLSHVRSVEAGY